MRERTGDRFERGKKMIRNAPYRRYVVIQIRAVHGGAGVWWHDRTTSAAEGFRILESRIAEEYLDRDARPTIALVDCTERRLLACSYAVENPSALLKWAAEYACRERTEEAGNAAPADQAPGGEVGAPGELSVAWPPYTDATPADESDSGDLQTLIDGVVKSFLAGSVDERLLEELQTELEESGDAHGWDDDGVLAVSRETLASALSNYDEETVRDALGLSDDDPLSWHEWAEYVEYHLLPGFMEDADVSEALGPLTITDSRGRSIILVRSVRGYSFSGVVVSWYPPFRSHDAFLKWVRRDWFTDPSEFGALSSRRKAAFLREAGVLPAARKSNGGGRRRESE
jgi:hypothetical protein